MGEQWTKQEGVAFWTPEKEDDELTGEVISIRDGEFGKQYEVRNGKDAFLTPSHKVLQSRMAKAKEGMTVKIVFTGEEASKTKGHSPTKMYDVYFQE